MSRPDNDKLSLSREQMIALGYKVVDMIVDYYQGHGQREMIRNIEGRDPGLGTREVPIPAAGQDPFKVLELVEKHVLADIQHVSDPNFFAYVPGPSNFVGAMADALCAGFNIFAGTATHSHGTAQVEEAAINWLKGLVGYPATAGGTFVSGGSVANLTGLILARHNKLEDDIRQAVLYCSDETHSCVDKALRILGFKPHQLIRIPTDLDFRMRTDLLEQRIAEDHKAGRRPLLVVGTLGTTSSGTVDPLEALAEICEREDLWFHVDAAYGGGALLSTRKRSLLKGVERAHSVAMDQHKWFFQPYECGTILVREMAWLHEFFHILPGYLKDSAEGHGSIHYRDHGIQLTRGLRALKLWMSLQTFGEQAFRDAVEWGLGLAEYAEALLRADPCWQIASPATLGIIAFRYRRPGLDDGALNRLNEKINQQVNATKRVFLSSTELKGRKALRLCTINPRVEKKAIRELLALLKQIGDETTP